MMKQPLLIVGASGRAAAASAIRNGFAPIVIDQFADADTRQLATTFKCDNYPSGLVPIARSLSPMRWMYTGGLENHPNIVDEISSIHSLIGIKGTDLKAVRDPFQLAKVLSQIHARSPRISNSPVGLSREGDQEGDSESRLTPADRVGEEGPVNAAVSSRWLVKSLTSSGGLGVREFRYHSNDRKSDYLQEYIHGEGLSGVFDSETLLGVSRLDSGVSWLHAPKYYYSGNVRHDDSAYDREFARVGKHLATAFNLIGRWGLDAIATPDAIYYLEINPRYTASMELFEHKGPGIGKAIYYAAKQFEFPADGPWMDSLQNCRDVSTLHAFADIPVCGTVIQAGQPVISIFTQGPSLQQCRINMQAIAADLDRLFGVEP